MSALSGVDTYLQNTLLGGVVQDLQSSGCSLFFVTSSVLSLVNGERNRERKKEQALHDEMFLQELDRQKELYEDEKEAEERAFNIWMRQQQRKFNRGLRAKRLKADRDLADMMQLFKEWPLATGIETIIRQIDAIKDSPNSLIPLHIVIGNHNMGEKQDILSKNHPTIVNNATSILNQFGITNIYSFREKSQADRDTSYIVGGPALANIYAVMNCFPTVVILPQLNQNVLSICIGFWNQESLFPAQKKLFDIEFDLNRVQNDKLKLEEKIKEITQVYVAIAAILNEAYLRNESCGDAISLTYKEYALQNSIEKNYPYLMNFANSEYNVIDRIPEVSKRLLNYE